MNKNFVIRDAVTVEVGGVSADLHNDFDLRDVSIFFGDGRVLFRFERYVDARSAIGPKDVTLEISGVDFLSVSAGDFGLENRTVVEMGYKSPSDFDHDWLAPENKAVGEDHLFIRLVGDGFIRVHGGAASVSFISSAMS